MVAKSVGEKIQMQMDEGGISLQHWVLPMLSPNIGSLPLNWGILY
jgi:hypothetical protein